MPTGSRRLSLWRRERKIRGLTLTSRIRLSTRSKSTAWTWNTWSRKTKATGFTMRRTAFRSTRRWRNFWRSIWLRPKALSAPHFGNRALILKKAWAKEDDKHGEDYQGGSHQKESSLKTYELSNGSNNRRPDKETKITGGSHRRDSSPETSFAVPGRRRKNQGNTVRQSDADQAESGHRDEVLFTE